MAPTNTITDVLNQWADWGVFAYILPFLVIFAIIYGILSNAKILGENMRKVKQSLSILLV